MASLRVGSVFAGEWLVLGRIAEGGMGTVYRVEQRSTGQLRALKVLRAGLWEDGRARERFEREAHVVSKIASEHITRVIAAGIDSDEGAPWIAMELLEGETLKKRVEREGPFGRLEALELARQLCHALAAAHEAGVVHRDLKPENVFIARVDRADPVGHINHRERGRETIKLLDFGIATALEEFETSATVTSVIGSPLWMAPEQVRRERIKPATDVWALGLLMFWVLTARPYWRKTFPADAVLFEKMVEPLVPASQRARELGCDDAIPPGFDPWFARCVSRRIDERYPDAGVAFDAFERIMTDPRMPRALPPSRARVAATIAAVAVLSASGAWYARPYLSPPATVDWPILSTAAQRDADAPTPRRSREEGRAPLADATSPLDSSAATALDATLLDATLEQRVSPDERALATVERPRTRGDSDASSHGLSSNAQSAAQREIGRAPIVAGFTVRRFNAAQSACSTGGAPYPWQVIPDWFLQRKSQLLLEERARRLNAERSMLSRITEPSALRTASHSIEEQQQNIDRDRAMLEAEIQRSLPALRASLAQRASEARCVEAGLRADIDGVYATWCCR